MPFDVQLSPAAEDDYQEILRYFEVRFQSTTAIQNFVTEFEEIVEKLEHFPGMFEVSRAPELRARGYHKFLIGNYVALYLIDEKAGVVYISRIFHGSRNYKKYL